MALSWALAFAVLFHFKQRGVGGEISTNPKQCKPYKTQSSTTILLVPVQYWYQELVLSDLDQYKPETAILISTRW